MIIVQQITKISTIEGQLKLTYGEYHFKSFAPSLSFRSESVVSLESVVSNETNVSNETKETSNESSFRVARVVQDVAFASQRNLGEVAVDNRFEKIF